ncbi:MAG: hypothetical protein ACHQ52_10280, partial [Candidatus Eisenbacteria bacterium]
QLARGRATVASGRPATPEAQAGISVTVHRGNGGRGAPSAASVLLGLVAASVAVYAIRVATAPLDRMVEFVPDDAFYYLVLARNFVRVGRWTSDAGLTLTSGFHLLHAYLLAGIYALFTPGNRVFTAMAVAWCTGLSLVAIGLAVLHERSTHRDGVLWAAALIGSSPNFMANAVSAMEWPLVVVAAATYVLLLHDRRRPRWMMFAVGFIGSLARSDFGLLPACLYTAGWMGTRDDARPYRRDALAGLLGAAFGVVAVLVHHAIASAAFLQYSARIKLHWSTFLTPAERIHAIPRQLLELTTGLEPSTTRLFNMAVFAVGALLLGRAALNALRRCVHGPSVPAATLATVVGSALAIIGYALVYTQDGEVQVWYSANLVVPVLCLLTAGIAAMGPRARAVFLSAIAVIVVHNVATVQMHAAHTMPHQRLMLAAGRYLAGHPEAVRGRVGAWNAGVMGFAQGGTIVNLDGLVNNEVYPYVVGDSLASYLARRGIGTIVDFDVMLTGRYAQRGGYGDGVLARSLRERRTIATDAQTGRSIAMFQVDPTALRSAPGDR